MRPPRPDTEPYIQGSLENPPGLPVSLCKNSVASDFDPKSQIRAKSQIPIAVRHLGGFADKIRNLGGFDVEGATGERSARNIKLDPDDLHSDAFLLKNLQVVTEDQHLDGIVGGKKKILNFKKKFF